MIGVPTFKNMEGLRNSDLGQTALRVRTLDEYEIMRTPAEEPFDQLTRLAATICKTPVSLVSLLYDDHQWFKSSIGTTLCETDIDISFCVHAIKDTEPLIVEDALLNNTFKNNPLVVGDPYIRFYAGFPLINPDGVPLGTLCVIDVKPGTLDGAQVEMMKALASTVGSLMEQRRLSIRLSKAQAEREHMLMAVSSIMISVDGDYQVQRWNQAAEEMFGLSAESVIGKPFGECSIKWNWHEIHDAAKRCFKENITVRLDDVQLEGHENQVKLLGLQFNPIKSQGQNEGFLLQGADITEKRAREVALQNQEKRYRSVVLNIEEIVFQADTHGNLTFLNPAWESVLGYSVTGSIGKNLKAFVTGLVGAEIERLLSGLTSRQHSIVHQELCLNDANGKERWVELFAELLEFGENGATGIVGTIVDITTRRRNEEILIHRQRFERLLASLCRKLLGATVETAHQIMVEALAEVCQYTDVDRGALYVQALNGIYRVDCEYTVVERPIPSETNADFSLERYPLMARTLKFGEPFVVDSLDNLPEDAWQERERLISLGLQSKIMIPLASEGHLNGFLSFGNSTPTTDWQSDFLALTNVLASIFVNLLDRIRAEECFRALSERTLSKFKNQLETVISNAPVILFTIDREEIVTLWDGKGLESLDLVPYEVIGKKISEVFPNNHQFRESLGEAFLGKSLSNELTFGDLTFQVQYSPVYEGENTEPSAVIGVALDITDRVHSEAALRLRDRAISAARNGIVITDNSLPDGPIIYANETFFRMTGYCASEVIGQNCRFLQGDDRNQEAISIMREAIASAKECRVILRNYRKDGSLFWNELTMYPVRDNHGLVTNFVGVQNDITKRRELEMQLSHSQKMEGIGLLAAGIAHEINTPMQYIGDNVRFLERAISGLEQNYEALLSEIRSSGKVDFEEALALARDAEDQFLLSEIPAAISQTLDGIEQVTKIIRALKEFSHPGTVEFVEIDLNRSIQSTITVARNEWKYVAEVETDFDSNLPLVQCLPSDFNQVVVNLIVNASHAIADMVRSDQLEMGKIRVTTKLEGDQVRVTVEDNGGGIPKSIQSRVFDPFYTTKGVGKGTGQGLAISRTIICEKHGGSISFESSPEEGTIFTVLIPLQQRPKALELNQAA